MGVNDEIYTQGLKCMFEFMNGITLCPKGQKVRHAFVTFVIRDIDDPEGNIDMVGNVPDDIAISILEECITTIKGRENEN